MKRWLVMILLVGCNGGDPGDTEVTTTTTTGSSETGVPTGTGQESTETGEEPTTGAEARAPKILFVSTRDGVQRMHWMNPDGSEQVAISSGTAIEYTPTWTRSGANVLFTRDSDVWLMRPESGTETNLTADPGLDSLVAVAPDGVWALFAGNREGTSDLYRVHTTGGVAKKLTAEMKGLHYFNAAYSPDGSQIAVGVAPDKLSGQPPRFVVLDAATGALVKDLGAVLGVTSNSRIDWSPDGAELLFIAATEGDDHLHSVKPDGSGLTTLATLRSLVYPVRSPDGERVAYYGAGPSGKDNGWRVFVVDRGGGEPTLVSTEGWSCYLPDWSPDSTQLVFQCGSDDGQVGENLYTVAAEGGPLTRLTADAGSNQLARWRP